MGLERAYIRSVSLALASAALFGCSNGTPSFSLLADENSFDQNPSITNGKIDILWVIDNSGSMDSSQQNVAQNFSSFIQLFNSKGMDYRMAVITTEAYRGIFASDEFARFRNGTASAGYTGVYVIEPSTPDLEQTFLQNMLQGINGSGDERAFQSIKEALTNAVNSDYDFPRQDAFLSVILVSDEDDFSHDGTEHRGGQYSYSGLHTVQSYVDFLDELTAGSALERNFNVNSIAILDQDCLSELNSEVSGRRIGNRYIELSEATNGVVGSLCGNFGEILSNISNRIIELTTAFYLTREPNPDSIQVFIDGSPTPRDSTNGWQYNAVNNSITFHGLYIPAAGTKITVRFDPVTIK